MSWKPRLLSLEESVAWIVISGFLYLVPAVLFGYGLHFRSWKEGADLVLWVGMFAYATWSAIIVGKRNRHDRIRRDAELSWGKNKVV